MDNDLQNMVRYSNTYRVERPAFSTTETETLARDPPNSALSARQADEYLFLGISFGVWEGIGGYGRGVDPGA